MLLFGPYLVETALWAIATTLIALWVTRVYLHTLFAMTFGRVKKTENIPYRKGNHAKNPPFVSILLAVYNERRVIDRLLKAVSAFDYPNCEIIVADDSTDKLMAPILARWERRKGIKVIHRNSRAGFKAGALNNAIKHLNPKSKYLLFFDADYLPTKEIVWRMLDDFSGKEVAAVQGYTKHTLNASQNIFTKSVSLAFSSYCMVDVAARERLNGFIPVAGSVFMLTRESLEKVGGFNENSITEDWELSSRYAAMGYRIVYDEKISVPAECPSTFMALVKQQMRWAEGIVRDTKSNLMLMLGSPRASAMEKFDYLFYGFSSINGVWGALSYVLTALMFLINARIIVILGIDRNLIASIGLFGQFLIFVAPVYIPISIIFAAAVGLYRERRLSHLPWCVPLFVVSLTLSPFIALASLKGLVLNRGSWARTPKTGKRSGG